MSFHKRIATITKPQKTRKNRQDSSINIILTTPRSRERWVCALRVAPSPVCSHNRWVCRRNHEFCYHKSMPRQELHFWCTLTSFPVSPLGLSWVLPASSYLLPCREDRQAPEGLCQCQNVCRLHSLGPEGFSGMMYPKQNSRVCILYSYAHTLPCSLSLSTPHHHLVPGQQLWVHGVFFILF